MDDLLDLPGDFDYPGRLIKNALDLRGTAGKAWLARLPGLVAACASNWRLVLAPAFPHLSYNFAAPGWRADGTPIVLKICYPDAELASEAAALVFFAGRGAAALLEADLDRGALLLEGVRPGSSLGDVACDGTDAVADERATSAAASVMRQLARPAPTGLPCPTFANWIDHLGERMATEYAADSALAVFPRRWIERAGRLAIELAASEESPVLLHGDLHHGNILLAEPAASRFGEPLTRQEVDWPTWLAIDPKGVIGEPIWETGPLLLNALPEDCASATFRPILARRVDQLAEEIATDRERLRAAGVVRAVLASFWMLEDHGAGWERDLVVAEALG